MIMHDVHYRKFDIKNEDTLEHPQHADERFDAIVANPPFSANWSASPLFMSDDRFANLFRDAKDADLDLPAGLIGGDESRMFGHARERLAVGLEEIG